MSAQVRARVAYLLRLLLLYVTQARNTEPDPPTYLKDHYREHHP